MKTKYLSLLILIIFLFTMSCAKNNNASEKNGTEIKEVEDTYFTIDLCNSVVRAYLDADTENEQFKSLKNMDAARGGNDFFGFRLTWKGEPYRDEYTVSVADNAKMKNSYKKQTYMNYLEVGHCVPGQRYCVPPKQAAPSCPSGTTRTTVPEGETLLPVDIDAMCAKNRELLEVLEHIPNVRVAIRNAVRLARRFAVVSVPSKPDNNPEHIHLLTKPILTAYFEEAGCKALRFDAVSGHLILIARKGE